jgi:hypothetical protein
MQEGLLLCALGGGLWPPCPNCRLRGIPAQVLKSLATGGEQERARKGQGGNRQYEGGHWGEFAGKGPRLRRPGATYVFSYCLNL